MKKLRFILLVSFLLAFIGVFGWIEHRNTPIVVYGNLSPKDLAEIKRAARSIKLDLLKKTVFHDLSAHNFKKISWDFGFFFNTKLSMVGVLEESVVDLEFSTSGQTVMIACLEKTTNGWVHDLKTEQNYISW